MRRRRPAFAFKSKLKPGVLFAAAVLSVGAGSAGAATHTDARIYTPFTSSGKPAVRVTKAVRGSCWEGSLAVAHRNAWRCMSGNLIYDPCFSSAKANGIVLCLPTGPWSSSAIKIKLTKKLPGKSANNRKPSTSGLPWALVTTSGWKCRLDTGATAVVNGKRLNYFCAGTKDGLWGAPSRRSQPWKIRAARPQAKKLSRTVAIRSAWF